MRTVHGRSQLAEALTQPRLRPAQIAQRLKQFIADSQGGCGSIFASAVGGWAASARSCSKPPGQSWPKVRRPEGRKVERRSSWSISWSKVGHEREKFVASKQLRKRDYRELPGLPVLVLSFSREARPGLDLRA